MAATAGTREISYPNGWDQSFTQVGESKVFQVTGKVYVLFTQTGKGNQWAASATTAIKKLLQKNSRLVRTFDIQPANVLSEQLLHSSHLAINGLAVCIFDRVVPARVSPMVRDIYFTRAILCNPVRCNGVDRAHAVEMDLLVKWMKITGRTNCPCGAQISNALLIVDEDIQFDCEDAAERVEAKNTGAMNESANVKERADNIRMKQVLAREDINKRAIAEFEENLRIKTGVRNFHLCSGAGKILIKGAGTLAAKHIAKVAAKETVKKGAKKTVARVIPGVSLVFGVGLGIKRFVDGDPGRGVLEIFSGAAACLPGAGTAVSLATDLAIGAIDINEHGKELAKKPSREVSQHLEITAENAYEILFGMEKEDCVRELKPDEMKRKINTLRRATHPDKSQQDGLSAHLRRRLTELYKLIQALHDKIKDDLDG